MFSILFIYQFLKLKSPWKLEKHKNSKKSMSNRFFHWSNNCSNFFFHPKVPLKMVDAISLIDSMSQDFIDGKRKFEKKKWRKFFGRFREHFRGDDNSRHWQWILKIDLMDILRLLQNTYTRDCYVICMHLKCLIELKIFWSLN